MLGFHEVYYLVKITWKKVHCYQGAFCKMMMLIDT